MELDATIKQVERLYQSVTGQEMPPMDPKAAVIPPEKDPTKHVEEQLGRLEQALSELSASPAPAGGPVWTPRLSVWESEETVFLCVNLPGVRHGDVKITCTEQAVVVEGQRSVPAAVADAKARPSFGEDVWGRFRRLIPIPPNVCLEEAEANLRDGLLTICMKKGIVPRQAERTIKVN